jgi:hypothetical protein
VFGGIEPEQRIDVAQPGLLKRSPPPRSSPPPVSPSPPPRPPPPPNPPALNVSGDTCTRAIALSGLWGLDVLDRGVGAPLLDSSYTWAPCALGTPVHVFVIDTGIYAAHQQVRLVSLASKAMEHPLTTYVCRALAAERARVHHRDVHGRQRLLLGR